MGKGGEAAAVLHVRDRKSEAAPWLRAGLEWGTEGRESLRGLLNMRSWQLRAIRGPWGDIRLSSPGLRYLNSGRSSCVLSLTVSKNHTTSGAPLGLGLGDGEEIDNLEKSFKLRFSSSAPLLKKTPMVWTPLGRNMNCSFRVIVAIGRKF